MAQDRTSRARRKLSGRSIRIRAETEADRADVRRSCEAAHPKSNLRSVPIQLDRVDLVLDHIPSGKAFDIGMIAETDRDVVRDDDVFELELHSETRVARELEIWPRFVQVRG